MAKGKASKNVGLQADNEVVTCHDQEILGVVGKVLKRQRREVADVEIDHCVIENLMIYLISNNFDLSWFGKAKAETGGKDALISSWINYQIAQSKFGKAQSKFEIAKATFEAQVCEIKLESHRSYRRSLRKKA